MTSEPDRKKRKMEPHLGGDTCRVLDDSMQKYPSGSASGDFIEVDQEVAGHSFISVVKKHSSNERLHHTEQYGTVRQGCDLGDEWTYRYPIPLSSYPKHTIKTGNVDYDKILPELATLGFRALQVIGRGRTSSLVLAQNLTKYGMPRERDCVPVVLKLNTAHPVSRARTSWKHSMGEEFTILTGLSHPCIVSWYGNIKFKNRVGVVLEFCENGNLDQLLKLHNAHFLTEQVARRYFRDIFSGLEFLHHQGIAHRDICAQNMLVTQSNTIKIADFGHACRFSSGDPLRNDDCGSPGYQAPEVLAKSFHNPKFTDIWSLGCLLYVMTTGKYPLGLIKNEILANSSKQIPFPKSSVLPVSEELKECLKGMLLHSPEERFTLNRIRHSNWYTMDNGKLQIGNFHLVRQPRKIKEGVQEQKLKALYEI